jgi:hypothetical protein
MPRTLIFLTIVVVSLVPAALVYSWSSSAVTGPATIRITSREFSRERVDVGQSGRGIGDTEIVRQHLFNRRIKSSPIGQAEYVCTFTSPTTRACTVTLFLPRGRLVAGGTIRYQELYELAVLGGTRLYDDARGTLTVTRTTLKPRRHLLLFRLTG